MQFHGIWRALRLIPSPTSTQALDGDAGNELSKLAEVVLVTGDNEIATKRGRGDYGRADRAFGSHRTQFLEPTLHLSLGDFDSFTEFFERAIASILPRCFGDEFAQDCGGAALGELCL